MNIIIYLHSFNYKRRWKMLVPFDFVGSNAISEGGMGRGVEGGSRLSRGSRLSGRWGGPGGGTGWYCTSSAGGTCHVLGSCRSGDGRDCKHAAGRAVDATAGGPSSLSNMLQASPHPCEPRSLVQIPRGEGGGGRTETWAIPGLSDPQWAPRYGLLYSLETGPTWQPWGEAAVTEWTAL